MISTSIINDDYCATTYMHLDLHSCICYDGDKHLPSTSMCDLGFIILIFLSVLFSLWTMCLYTVICRFETRLVDEALTIIIH